MLIESDPVARTFDTAPFVNYMSDDLTTPTESELVEELPEWQGRQDFERKVQENSEKPRRGVGFLRSETAPEVIESPTKHETEKSEPPADEFGDGLFPETDQTKEGESKPPAKRKRRRRRRKQNKPDTTQTTTSDQAAETSPSTDGQKGSDPPSGESTETAAKSGRKRRRRRRRRRKPSDGNQTSDE